MSMALRERTTATDRPGLNRLPVRGADVRVGERFIERADPGRIMRVTYLLHLKSGIDHARLRDVFDPTRSRLVSCRALCDPSAFRRLS